jgi:hypothetical protein
MTKDIGSQSRHVVSGEKRPVKRTLSCPPGHAHSVSTGPWSIEWANRHKCASSGAVRPLSTERSDPTSSGVSKTHKMKGNGYICHCAQNLKRIARLSDKDRREVLRALRKGVTELSKDKVTYSATSPISGSQALVNNNDWTNWLVVHGNEQVLSDDARVFGKVVGVNFKGDKNNMFDVLSGVGRKKLEGGGKVG